MKQIPILFSIAMVQAILAGRKTVTRQTAGLEEINEAPDKWSLNSVWRSDKGQLAVFDRREDLSLKEVKRFINPYGQSGDLLWVKETFYAYGWWTQEGTTKKGKPAWHFKDFTPEDQGGRYHYMDNPPAEVVEKRMYHEMGWHKRPAIFMPYDAARIWLERTGIIVERLRDITVEQAIAEGLAQITKDGGRTWKYGIPDTDGLPGNDNNGWPWSEWCRDPRQTYFKLWEKINGRESLEANPWLWAPGFKILSTTGKPAGLEKEVVG